MDKPKFEIPTRNIGLLGVGMLCNLMIYFGMFVLLYLQDTGRIEQAEIAGLYFSLTLKVTCILCIIIIAEYIAKILSYFVAKHKWKKSRSLPLSKEVQHG